jgi:hypothetical protein
MSAHAAGVLIVPLLRREWKIRLTADDAVVLGDLELLKTFPVDSLWCHGHGPVTYEGHGQTAPVCILEKAVAGGKVDVLRYLIDRVGVGAFEKCLRVVYLVLTPTILGDRAPVRALFKELGFLTSERLRTATFTHLLRDELAGRISRSIDKERRTEAVKYYIGLGVGSP